MKLGVFAVLLANQSLEEALKYLHKLGVQAVEIGTGGYPGNEHASTENLMNKTDLQAFKDLLKKYEMEISALSCHGNPVHPNKEIADKFHSDFEKTVLLAEKLGVSRVITFSGCPGDPQGSLYPNWVTCPWPEDFLKILDYQWNDILIPYWQKTASFARNYGVEMICLEMHPNFCVYNPETLLRLRAAVGETIGANFDPSHLFWQGIEPVAAIRKLGPAIYHFHAKDCKIDPLNTGMNGVLDTKHYGDEINRSWIFRTVGYGHGPETWRDMISNLRMVGYDHVLSIEHEDSLMSVDEGLQKAVGFLKEIMISQSKSEMWWA